MSVQDRSQKRRREILMAALHCFTVHGIQGATIDMIRAQSGASVGSLYHHFGNKEKIVQALYIEGVRDYQNQLLVALDNTENAEDGIRHIVETFIDWITDNPDWARFVFYARSQVATMTSDVDVQRESRQFWEYLQAWFNEQVTAGSVRKLSKECYSSLIIGPAQDYARRWLSGRVKAPLLEQKKVFSDAAWRAVANA